MIMLMRDRAAGSNDGLKLGREGTICWRTLDKKGGTAGLS
jgi:hypothetical protein